MQLIHIETRIAAPPERCFLLSLSIDLHVASTEPTRERAIAGRTQGIIGRDETVTWRGRHFGLMLTHTSLIDSFEHEHFFEPTEDGGTLMRDELRFAAPWGPLGRLVEKLVLRRYFLRFLKQRDEMIRRVAEGDEWQRYLLSSSS